MSWQLAILLIFGILLVLMATGMPVAFAFMITCSVGAFLFWGGWVGLQQLATSYFTSIALFIFLPLPLFILMGCIVFESGVGIDVVNTVDKLLGRLPGRLSVVALAAGIMLGTVTGVSSAGIGILGKVLVPEMTKRGYHKSISMGPIVGAGLICILIPPSALAVTLGAIGKVDIGALLIAIIVPGLLMAGLFMVYVIIRCMLNPALAPTYEIPYVPLSEKIRSVVRYLLPLGIVVLAVIGSVFLGIATPTEASALGVISCYLLAAISGKLNWRVVKNSALSTIEVTVMMFMILISAISFGRIMASSGALAGIINLATNLNVAPILVIILTQLIVLFLGGPMDEGSVLMITAPTFVQIATALGYNPVWYGVIMLINIELGLISPPLGMAVFVMKGLAPPDVSVGDVFKSSMPFLLIGLLVMILIMVFPPIALWLPGLMS